MTHRQIYIGIAGLVLALIGAGALLFPVYLDQFDIYGMKINCGNGIGTVMVQTQVEGETAQRCGTALLVRRLWAIPTLVLGWLLVTGFLVMWVRDGQREPDPAAEPPHYVPHPEIAGPTTRRWNEGAS
ncbi:hypothetical protein [Mycobacterium asiaticum]|uniref:Transmembrane protein n=1 Tax=Mycobacterium asiaticum TaxID=1790 RepID=A0A1A3N3U2_MYCAS|nr:hypothetical protein [Mycobacterium asiaticum]OBK15042.1 hypothetical protein A5636_06565 [Mycobacterium asiaticum]